MLHAHRSVTLAFVRAQPAGQRARLQDSPGQFRVLLARDETAGGITQIRAMQVEPNATDQVLYLRLAETGIRTRGARLCAVEGGQRGV